MTGHLSTRQIEELIIDGADLQTRDHLITCEVCRLEWGRMDEALQQYKSCARLVADSAITAQPNFTGRALHSSRKSHFLVWICASALLFGVTVPLYEHHREEQQQRAAKIARDNLLLEQVDIEISEPVPQPLESLRHLVVTERNSASVLNDRSKETR